MLDGHVARLGIAEAPNLVGLTPDASGREAYRAALASRTSLR